MEKLNDYIYEIIDECTAPYKSMIDNLVIAIIILQQFVGSCL